MAELLDGAPFDVVVAGCGLAGSVAALRAQQLGCRTLLVDKAPDGTAAGNTRLSGGAFHAAGGYLDDPAERIAARIDEVTEGQWNGDKVVLMAFPDRETFTTWLTSPEYREIARDRLAAADTTGILVRGLMSAG